MKKYSAYLAIWIWFYIVVIMPSLYLIHVLYLFTPDIEIVNTLVKQIPVITDLVLISLLFAGIGALLSNIGRQTKLVFILNLPKNKISFIGSLLLAFILWRFMDILRSLGYIGLFILIIFFLFYLPIVTLFLRSTSFSSFKNTLPSENLKQIPAWEVIKNFLLFILILLSINMTVFLLGTSMQNLRSQLYIMLKSPKIYSYEPKIIYYSNKVILTGQNFGWKGTIQTSVKYQKGLITIDLWTDNKIIFTVPLHWPIGNIYVWIEKPMAANIVKSNIITLRLISRDNGWDKDDNTYFEQLKHLKKETLEINGYIQ